MKIKKEFKDRVVAYNGSGLPLGQRKDIHVLAEIAVKSGDESLLMLFEERPTLEAVQKQKAKKFLANRQSQGDESKTNTETTTNSQSE